MEKRSDDYPSLDLYSEFLLGLLDKNPGLRDLMRRHGLYDGVVNALQHYCVKSNHLHTAHASRPINFKVLEEQKDSLREYISYFEDNREQSDQEEEDQFSDVSSQPSVPNYKRQQPIQY